MDLTADESTALRALLTKGPGNATSLRAKASSLERLAARGLAAGRSEMRARGRSVVVWSLTEPGRAVAEDLPPAKPTARDAFLAVVALRREVRDLRARLAALEGVRGSDDGARHVTASPADFERALRDALTELDRGGSHGGLVPIPEVWRALAPLGLPRAAFDEALLACEREFVVDLKVANDGRATVDRDGGIRDAGRGLLYYVVQR